jgi:hypothetical protein
MKKVVFATIAVLVLATCQAHAWSHQLEQDGPHETKCVLMWPDHGNPPARVPTNSGTLKDMMTPRSLILAYAFGVAAHYNRDLDKPIALRDRAEEFLARLKYECQSLERAEYTPDEEYTTENAKRDRDQRFVSQAAV